MTRYPSYKKSRRLQRERRHRRVRKKIWGTADRPRLVVHRSLNHTEGQLVDDDVGETLLGISTRSGVVQEADLDGDHRKTAEAHAAGKRLAEKAREAGIEAAVFDRGGYKYHGRVKAFAEGAREGGLEF